MEKVIYSCGGGLGIILTNELESDFIEKKSTSLHNERLEIDSFTDLDKKFTSPVRFAGFLKNENNLMCFHAGDEDDLFDNKSYYYCFYRISENVIANKYKEGTARDYKWINNKWK